MSYFLSAPISGRFEPNIKRMVGTKRMIPSRAVAPITSPRSSWSNDTFIPLFIPLFGIDFFGQLSQLKRSMSAYLSTNHLRAGAPICRSRKPGTTLCGVQHPKALETGEAQPKPTTPWESDSDAEEEEMKIVLISTAEEARAWQIKNEGQVRSAPGKGSKATQKKREQRRRKKERERMGIPPPPPKQKKARPERDALRKILIKGPWTKFKDATAKVRQPRLCWNCEQEFATRRCLACH